MSSRAADLHPDDLAARLGLRAQFVQLRHNTGLGLNTVGTRVGTTGRAIWDMEKGRSNGRISLYQRWARALNTRLHVRLEGLDEPGDGDPYTHGLRQIKPADDAHADRIVLQLLVADLRRHREWLGLTVADLAARCQIADSAITRLEHSDPAAVMLATVQRTARALGGHLEVRLDVPVVVA